MNHKFQYKVCDGQIVDMDWPRFEELHRGLPDGDYDLIQRERMVWDTNQMRKYFHSGCLSHFQSGYRNTLGNPEYGIEDIKRFLKAKYLGFDDTKPFYQAMVLLERYRSEAFIAPSTADIQTFLEMEVVCAGVGAIPPIVSTMTLHDRPELYKKFLRDLNGYSIFLFKCELPPAEQVD